MSNIGYKWFNQGFILEVRKMAVMIKLLQSIIWACCLYIINFFQIDNTLLLPAISSCPSILYPKIRNTFLTEA
uniref:Uncharacterized protein n=1 Tax=Moschus moschiferus TaxID=68415 RepID=A0A8C6FKP5_MOSMO